jgi:hypothetical protein
MQTERNVQYNKNKIYRPVGTIPKSNMNIVERCKPVFLSKLSANPVK